jgi:choice-of-anchor C domain-containing protein
MRKTVVLLSLLFSTAFILGAGSLTNGSFESNVGCEPAYNSSGFTTLGAGDPCITGWTILNRNIDYITFYWQAADGSHSLDMNGSEGLGASVQQMFDTNIGVQYHVSFSMAANTNAAPALKLLHVDAAGQSQDYTFDGSGHGNFNMGWAKETFSFNATGTSTTLTFTSLTTECCAGPALDAVSVSAPEPGSTGLLVIGVALLILGRRSFRRRLV